MMRSRGKNLTGKAVQDKGPSRLASASTPPCILPPCLLLFLFALLRILVVPAESSPAPLSLNKDQLKALINKSPGRWYPMKGPGMKEMLQFKPFCWHSGLFDKHVLPLQKMLHDCSKHPKHSTLTKETIKHRPLRGVRKAPQILWPQMCLTENTLDRDQLVTSCRQLTFRLRACFVPYLLFLQSFAFLFHKNLILSSFHGDDT